MHRLGVEHKQKILPYLTKEEMPASGPLIINNQVWGVSSGGLGYSSATYSVSPMHEEMEGAQVKRSHSSTFTVNRYVNLYGGKWHEFFAENHV